MRPANRKLSGLWVLCLLPAAADSLSAEPWCEEEGFVVRLLTDRVTGRLEVAGGHGFSGLFVAVNVQQGLESARQEVPAFWPPGPGGKVTIYLHVA